jgi:hypothetical protein
MTTITQGVDKGANGRISYSNAGNKYVHNLWVNVVSQSLGLSGQSAQSRLRKVFYPRANQVGNLKIEGQCQSQTDYQELALFIKKHQRILLSAPYTDLYTRQSTKNEGPNRLIRLEVPSEGIYARGFIESFSISKKGFFEPAPNYEFELVIVFDRTHENYAISHELQKYFKGSKKKFAVTSADDNLTNEEQEQRRLTAPPRTIRGRMVGD